MAVESKIRAHLARFGFVAEKAEVKSANLSGGEKARLLFAIISIKAPHLLLLDEPTNHLDVDARESLVQALNAYEGAVILVSHDAHLIDLVCDQLWEVKNSSCTSFDGSLDDYRNVLIEQPRISRSKCIPNSPASKSNRKDIRSEKAQQRATTAALRKAIREKERQIEHLIAERTILETHLGNPIVYQGSTKELMELQIRYGDIKSQLTKIENIWVKMNENLEIAD